LKRKRPTGQKSKPKKRKPRKGPPPKTGSWRKRKFPRGERARRILRRIRNKRTESEIRTAIQLVKDDDMNETEFINFVMSLDVSATEAYTFYFSPP